MWHYLEELSPWCPASSNLTLVVYLAEALAHMPQEKEINENVYKGIVNSKKENWKQPNFPSAKD